MTFFIVAGRALKKLSFFWEVYKDPSKFFKARALIFIFSFMFLSVWAFMDYHLLFKQYKDVVYPPLSKMNVDSGTWFFSQKRGEYSYLQTQNGRKILFDGSWKISQYRDEQCRSIGLTSLSENCPEIHAKIWWFPKVHSSANQMGQIEIDEKVIASYEEGREVLKKQQDHSKIYTQYNFLLILMLIMLVWEFLVQYIIYRQENN
jgi:hypothetical protein